MLKGSQCYVNYKNGICVPQYSVDAHLAAFESTVFDVRVAEFSAEHFRTPNRTPLLGFCQATAPNK